MVNIKVQHLRIEFDRWLAKDTGLDPLTVWKKGELYLIKRLTFEKWAVIILNFVLLVSMSHPKILDETHPEMSVASDGLAARHLIQSIFWFVRVNIKYVVFVTR